MTSPRHLLHTRRLFVLPISMLAMALGADIALMVTAASFWAAAAEWLLLGTLISGLLAAAVTLIGQIATDRLRRARLGYWIGIVILAVTGANYLLRLGGDADFAGSYGLVLTAAAIGLVMLAGRTGGEPIAGRGIGAPAIGQPDTEAR